MREIAAPELAKLTTMRLGGKAIAMLMPESIADFKILPEKLERLGGRPFVLGKGSNLLAAGGELPITLIKLALKEKLEVWSRHGDKFYVRVSANVPLRRVLRFCLENGLSGLEGLVGIPGSTGGAAAMNAGSFGIQVGEKIHALTVWQNNELKFLNQKDMNFGYRQWSVGKKAEKPIILEVIFALTRASKGVIFSRMNLNIIEKKSRQPLSSWSAGCAFKNPPGNSSAGKLLDMSGFRGKRKGGMAFSSRHANFLINEGKGSPEAAFELLEEARAAVKKQFGTELETEIRIIR